MKYDQIEDFSDEQFLRLIGGVEAMSLEKCNTKRDSCLEILKEV